MKNKILEGIKIALLILAAISSIVNLPIALSILFVSLSFVTNIFKSPKDDSEEAKEKDLIETTFSLALAFFFFMLAYYLCK